MNHRVLLALLLAVAFLLAGCFGPDDDTPTNGSGTGGDDESVTITRSGFHPQELVVPPGTTVIWTNEDSISHTATADDGSWDAGTFGPGQSDGATFSDEGEYPYHCAFHPGMTGTITVVR
jgi:plastocyanin